MGTRRKELCGARTQQWGQHNQIAMGLDLQSTIDVSGVPANSSGGWCLPQKNVKSKSRTGAGGQWWGLLRKWDRLRAQPAGDGRWMRKEKKRGREWGLAIAIDRKQAALNAAAVSGGHYINIICNVLLRFHTPICYCQCSHPTNPPARKKKRFKTQQAWQKQDARQGEIR